MLRGLSKTNTSKSKDHNKALAVALVFFILGALGILFAKIYKQAFHAKKNI